MHPMDPQLSSPYLLCCFSGPFFKTKPPKNKKLLFFALSYVSGRRRTPLSQRPPEKANEGLFRSLAQAMGSRRFDGGAERLGSVRLRRRLMEVLHQRVHTASVCKAMTALCLLQVIISTA